MNRYAYGGDVNINPAPPAQAARVMPQQQATYPFPQNPQPQQTPQAMQVSADAPMATLNTPTAGLFRKGGKVKAYAKGGAVSASRRGDGVAQRGKTKGRMV